MAMHILDRYPKLRGLTPIEVEGLAQNVITDLVQKFDDDPTGSLEQEVAAFCAQRDARLEELWPEIKAGLYETQLAPEPNEEQREAIFALVEADLRKLDTTARLAVALELYEFAALEEGPMDPILLAELQQRIEDFERNPSSGISLEEMRRRFEEWKKQWKKPDSES